MNAEDLMVLNQEIAGMARAGLPLDQGLAALAREMGRGRLRRVTAQIADDLRSGLTLPEALHRQRGHVPPFYVGLIQAGIRSGRLAEVLMTLTTYARSMADLRTTVVNAFFYPAVVLTFAVVMFIFTAYYILPQFQVIFTDFKLRLPAITQAALFIGGHPLAVLGVLFLGIPGGLLLLRLALGTSQRGEITWARFVYAVPLVGTLVRAARLAAFSELLAILVDHQTPLPEAFGLAGQASSDPIMGAASGQVEHDLRDGVPLGQSLRQRRLVPELIAWMTGLGEQRGNLGETLHQVALVYRRQAEMRAAFLRTVLPPLLVIGTSGVLVGVFAFSIMIPMVKLIEALGK